MYNSQSPSSNASRIIGYGLRNPFRFTFRPGTSELWVGDVGWNTWEEVNRMTSPTPANPVNFGWPCYEGAGRHVELRHANLTICENLYTDNTRPASGPYYNYNHSASVVSGDGCSLSNGSVISAISFYPGGSYPGVYNGALFFGDHSRNCIWAMLPGGNGLPNANNLQAFVVGGSHPVDLTADPASGDLFYANFEGGQIRRIQWIGGNNPPQAVASANPTSGPAPLTVQFTGSGSSDPDGDAISYAWDLDGDSVLRRLHRRQPELHLHDRRPPTRSPCGSPTPAAPRRSAPRSPSPSAGQHRPHPGDRHPAASLTWAVGDTISFSGRASDTQDGTLPASALTWEVILNHCTTGCHTHGVQTFTGVASGTFTAPDHDYPSSLEVRLTARDSAGLTATRSVTLQPRTVNLTFQSNPTALQLTAGATTARAPFTVTAIVNQTIQLIAPQQKYRGKNYAFVSWSDGGGQTHTIRAPSTATTYTATFQRVK